MVIKMGNKVECILLVEAIVIDHWRYSKNIEYQ